jgi:phage shock protein A
MEEEVIEIGVLENFFLTAIQKYGELLEQSEKRIASTNDMVRSLAESSTRLQGIVERLTNEYTKHLDTLTSNRDEVVKQNGELIKLVAKTNQMYEDTAKRYDRLFECFESHSERIIESIISKTNLTRNASESNINIGK